MDVRVSLSISLLRDQLGAVIEHAVTNAVETVLEEILKVVGCKFEEFGREMTAKERENESIRKMLEISRCQMKTMRKYLSAVSAKDERHFSLNQRFEPNRTLCTRGGEIQSFPNINRTRKDDGHFTLNGRTDIRHSNNQAADMSEGLSRATQLRDGTAMKDRELAVSESQDTRISGPIVHQQEHSTPVKEEHGDPPERPGGGTCETEPSHEDFDNPSLHKPDSIATATTGTSPLAKEEEPEMQLIYIKEEPPELEMHTMSPRPQDHLSRSTPSAPHLEQERDWDRAEPTTSPAETAVAALSSSTCWAGRQQALEEAAKWQALRLQRAEFHVQRAELKRRGQLRRRERELSLPQPLQDALERERREKTRIRVARWRAKRKLQAAAAAAGLPVPQTEPAHASDPLRLRQPYGGLPYGGPLCENGALYAPLHIGPELTDALVQPDFAVLQQGILGTDSELFQ